jgi:hypothetical protein
MKNILQKTSVLIFIVVIITAIITDLGDKYRNPLSYENYLNKGDIFVMVQTDTLELSKEPTEKSNKYKILLCKSDSIYVLDKKALTNNLYYIEVMFNGQKKGWIGSWSLPYIAVPLNGKSEVSLIKYFSKLVIPNHLSFWILFLISVSIISITFLMLRKFNVFFLKKDYSGEEKYKPLISSKTMLIPCLASFILGYEAIFFPNYFVYSFLHPNLNSWHSILLLISILSCLGVIIFIIFQTIRNFTSSKIKKQRILFFSILVVLNYISGFILSISLIIILICCILLFFLFKILSEPPSSNQPINSNTCPQCHGVYEHRLGCTNNGQMTWG